MSFKDQEGATDAPPSLKIFDQALKAYNPWAYESLLIGEKPRKFLTEDNFSLSPATIQLANEFYSRYLGRNLNHQPLNEESLQQQRARHYPDGRILFGLPYSRVITGEDIKMGYIKYENLTHKKYYNLKITLNAIPIIESILGNVYISNDKVYLLTINPFKDASTEGKLSLSVLGDSFYDFSTKCLNSNHNVDASGLFGDRQSCIIYEDSLLRNKIEVLSQVFYRQSAINFSEIDELCQQSGSWRDLSSSEMEARLDVEIEAISNERIALQNEFKALGPGIDISVLQSNSQFKPVSVSTSNKALKQISEDVAVKLAAKIFEKLRANTTPSSLIAVEISYLDGGLPTLIPLTQNDTIGMLVLVTEIPASHWLNFSADESLEGLEEFNQMVEDSLSSEPRAKMLRSAARQVTELARAQLPVSPDFVAYAINWEMEGDDIAKILKQCGATPTALKNWKKKGWIL